MISCFKQKFSRKMSAENEQTFQNSSSQISSPNSLLEFTKEPMFYWILFNAILSVYVAISLSIYEYRIPKNGFITLGCHWKFTDLRFNSMPRIFCWLASLCMLMYWFSRLVLSKLLLNSTTDLCSWDYRIRTSTVTASRLFLVLVLWCRQRSFYSNKFMKKLSNKFSQLLSIVVGIIAVGGNLGTLSIFVFAVESQKKNESCVFIKGGQLQLAVFQHLRFFLIAVHVGVTGLFLVPLLKHNSRLARNNRESKNKSNSHIKELIIRSLSVSIVYVILDFLPFLLPLFEDRDVGTVIFAHTSLTIPMILTIFIFVDWKLRLFPMKKFDAAGQDSNGEKRKNSHKINAITPIDTNASSNISIL